LDQVHVDTIIFNARVYMFFYQKDLNHIIQLAVMNAAMTAVLVMG